MNLYKTHYTSSFYIVVHHVKLNQMNRNYHILPTILSVFISLSFITASTINAQTPTCTPDWYSCNPASGWCCNSSFQCNGYCTPLSTSPSPPPPIPTALPTNLPTITPSYGQICTGWDGSDTNNICQRFSCTGTPLSACEQHGGRCLTGGYCYPSECRCGHSSDDCPTNYTCQSTINSQTCDGSKPKDCRPGNLNCTNGYAQLQCTNTDNCIDECGQSIAYCHAIYGCYVPSTCGALAEGAGTCTTVDTCPDERERGQIDCLPGLVCCAPPPECIGVYSGEPGTCHFLGCPPDTHYDGSNPPNNISCGLGQFCCTKPSKEWVERNSLDVKCTTPSGNEGINTAVGCISTTSPTSLLSFILPWAVGVGGGTSFILMIVAGFLIMTSAGDPQKAKAAKELLGAAIAGLLMIVFSVYLLDVIGIRILKFPGL